MMAEDSAVWTRYLKNPLVAIKEVWYDVHVGRQVPTPDGPGSQGFRIAAGLTRKRIDVVAAVAGGFWLVEVKPYASYLAVGQVVTYLSLFLQEYDARGEVWGVIVCDQVDPDIVDMSESMGVAIVSNEYSEY